MAKETRLSFSGVEGRMRYRSIARAMLERSQDAFSHGKILDTCAKVAAELNATDLFKENGVGKLQPYTLQNKWRQIINDALVFSDQIQRGRVVDNWGEWEHILDQIAREKQKYDKGKGNRPEHRRREFLHHLFSGQAGGLPSPPKLPGDDSFFDLLIAMRVLMA
eukprot:3077-Hanusia_phi.AAC.1